MMLYALHEIISQLFILQCVSRNLTKFYYQKTRSWITLIRRKWIFRCVIPENYIKILDNVSIPKVFNEIQRKRIVSRSYIFYANIQIYVIERWY